MISEDISIKELEQFIKTQKDEEVKIPKSMLLDLLKQVKENKILKEKLQISPYSDDKIDELTQTIDFLHFRLQLAMKKQIPQKPKDVDGYFSCQVCSICDFVLDDISYNYCPNCGQKLDWSSYDR